MKFYTIVKSFTLCLIILFFISCGGKKEYRIDLSGDWSFQVDSLDQGTKWTGNIWDNDSVWYKDPKMAKYRQKGNIKLPFWLTPNNKYTGAAWYQKKVTIPSDWKGKKIDLHLERVHWESTVWIDDAKIGMQNSLATAHDYNLGAHHNYKGR